MTWYGPRITQKWIDQQRAIRRQASSHASARSAPDIVSTGTAATQA